MYFLLGFISKNQYLYFLSNQENYINQFWSIIYTNCQHKKMYRFLIKKINQKYYIKMKSQKYAFKFSFHQSQRKVASI